MQHPYSTSPTFTQFFAIINKKNKLQFSDYYFLEPVGAKAPTFNTVSKISSLLGKSFGDIVLLCQAQAYPVPFFR